MDFPGRVGGPGVGVCLGVSREALGRAVCYPNVGSYDPTWQVGRGDLRE